MAAIFAFNSSTKVPYLKHLPLWILWRIWKSRNILVFQRKNVPWKVCLTQAKQDAKEWLDTEAFIDGLTPTDHNLPFTTETRLHWSVPKKSWIKCNYDGSFFTDAAASKAGWVLRDENGSYIGACQARGMKTNTPLEAELQSLILAMQHCWSKGITKIIFEGDNREVEELMNKKKINFQVHNWIREARFWQSKFKEVKFEWVKRECNKVADKLAKSSLASSVNFLFHFYVPHFIVQDLHCDHLSRFAN